MNQFDPEEIKKKKEKIQEFLWSMDEERYPDKEVFQIFKNNLDLWVNTAHKFRQKYPAEIGFFIAKNYISSFFYRFITDEMSTVKKKKRYTRIEKIQIIKDAFEKAYHHFGLLSIISNYSEEFGIQLSEDWYTPSSASEFDEKNPSRWQNDKGKGISGREWSILKLPFLSCLNFDPDVFRSIRVADSHGRIVYERNRVIILGRSGKVDYILPDRTLNNIFNFVLSSIRASAYFSNILLIKNNFWVAPAIILTKPQAFGFSSSKIPEVPGISTRKRKNRKIPDQKQKDEKPQQGKIPFQNLVEYSAVIIDFLVNGFWRTLDMEKEHIALMLEKYDLEFDFEKFKASWQDMKYEFLQSIVDVAAKMNKIATGADAETIIISKDSFEQFDWVGYVKKSYDIWIEFKKFATKDQRNSYFGEFFTGGFYILFSPAGKFLTTLNVIVKEKPEPQVTTLSNHLSELSAPAQRQKDNVG